MATSTTVTLLGMVPPPARVVAEFSTDPADVIPLPGGRGTSWRAGDLVLKPLDMLHQQLEWEAEVLPAISTHGFRVAAPIRSKSGELVVDGWVATTYLKGEHRSRWPEIISVGQRFHDALVGVSRPDVLDLRQDTWAVADRVAWEQAVPSRVAQSIPGVGWLLDAREPVRASPQLIHGDLSGNVIFADDAAPAVIDFSPYWRPRDYASAIVAVDAIAWSGADLELMDDVLAVREGRQMLIRALLFRLLSDTHPAGGRYELMIDRLAGGPPADSLEA